MAGTTYRCPECGTPAGTGSPNGVSRWLLGIVALLVVVIPAAGTIERCPAGIVGVGQPLDYGLRPLWRDIDVGYLKSCAAGVADASVLRHDLSLILDRHRGCPPVKFDPLVVGAGPPVGTVVEGKTRGYPLLWCGTWKSTVFSNVFSRSDPVVQRLPWLEGVPLGKWRMTSPCCMRRDDVIGGTTSSNSYFSFLALGNCILLVVLAAFLCGRACRSRRFGIAILGSVTALLLIGGAIWTRDESSVYMELEGAHPVASLSRAEVTLLIDSDDGVCEVAKRMVSSLGEEANDSWSVFAGFTTEAPGSSTNTQWGWGFNTPLISRQAYVAQDPEQVEWRRGWKGGCRYGDAWLSVDAFGTHELFRLSLERAISLITAFFVIWRALCLSDSLIRTRRRLRRTSTGRCTACGYPLDIPDVAPELSVARG